MEVASILIYRESAKKSTGDQSRYNYPAKHAHCIKFTWYCKSRIFHMHFISYICRVWAVRASRLLATLLRISWPAISDIWLGIRTVPVLSVAKESRGASQIAHWPRSARAHCAGRCGLTDRRSSVKKLLSFVHLLMFPSLLEEITGHGMPVECSKLTCFVKVKIRHGSRAVRSTIEVGRCQSSFAYRAEFDLGKGKNRSKATYPHWKDENNSHHWQTNPNLHVYESESQSEVDVRWPAMYA